MGMLTPGARRAEGALGLRLRGNPISLQASPRGPTLPPPCPTGPSGGPHGVCHSSSQGLLLFCIPDLGRSLCLKKGVGPGRPERP